MMHVISVMATRLQVERYELDPRTDFSNDDPVAVCIGYRSPDSNGIAFKQRLRPRQLQFIERSLRDHSVQPTGEYRMLVYDEIAGDFIGSKLPS